MTETPAPLSTQSAVPSQTLPLLPEGPTVKEDVVTQKVEPVEEEPYTIKCICNFSDDDGSTIYCETCDTWQHIDCFYPNNRDEAIREDFAHSCAECKPRPLDRQKAIERTTRLRNVATDEATTDKKTKRPPSKSHKKKPKPSDLPINTTAVSLDVSKKHQSSSDTAHPPKKSKSSHRPSQSISSQPSKQSPSLGTGKSTAHPPSPATSPPDLPDDFRIHHYSKSFCSLYSEHDVPDAHNNSFASLQIPTKLAVWLRDPIALKTETHATLSDVFQTNPRVLDLEKPKLEVQDVTRSILDEVVRWRSLKTTSQTASGYPLIELNGEIGFQAEYCANPDNLWTDLSSPLPFVFFHPILPLYIDTRQEGSLARYVRRSCKPNAQLDTYLSGGSEYHFWIVADRWINAHEPITLPWDFRLDARVGTRWLNLLGLSDDEQSIQNEPEVTEEEYTAISNWIDRILSEYGGCACDLDNNCAFARFHRQYLWTKNGAGAKAKKKPRKPKTQAVSPISTGPPAHSRAASEGHLDDGQDQDGRSQSGSSRSKPPSRDLTPLRQGSFDQLGILTELTDRDKRKVAMVEDTFRRLEQQQQPPRKKKRISDGTNGSSSSKPKSRNGSTVSQGKYVDSSTGRSKSGSPVTTQSPQLDHGEESLKPDSSDAQSRQSSACPQRDYCDAAVQTDPVEGEWFSESLKSPRPRKKITSLSKKLLNSRYKIRTSEERQRRQSFTSQVSATSMDVDQPVAEHTPAVNSEAEERPAVIQESDVTMADAPSVSPVSTSAAITNGDANSTKTKTPDLRLHLPPVPAFDNSGVATQIVTPLSAGSTMLQSPLSANLTNSPFVPPAVNGIAAHPSPVKKKLSLSDYTKSRMNKAAGKVAGGTTCLKPTTPSPEDTKVDIILESNSLDKPSDHRAASTAPTTNGAS